MRVELSVHHQHAVSSIGGSLDVAILCLLVGGIKHHHIVVLIGLSCFYKLLVVVELEELAIDVFEKRKLHCRLTEFLIGEHSILNEYLYVVPLILKVLCIVLCNLFEAG